MIESIACYSSLGLNLRFLCVCGISDQDLLPFKVPIGKSGKSGVILVCLSLCYMALFPFHVLMFFLFFFLYVFFSFYMTRGLSFLVQCICLFVSARFLYLHRHILVYVGKVSSMVLLNIFSLALSWISSPTFTPIILKFCLFMLFQISWMLCVNVFIVL